MPRESQRSSLHSHGLAAGHPRRRRIDTGALRLHQRDARQGRPRRPDRRLQRVAENTAREGHANQVHHLAPAQRLFISRRHRGRVAAETGQARGPRHLRRALHAQRGELRVFRRARRMSQIRLAGGAVGVCRRAAQPPPGPGPGHRVARHAEGPFGKRVLQHGARQDRRALPAGRLKAASGT